MVFSIFDIEIKMNSNYLLYAPFFGEEISQSRHELRCDVKAITYHLFDVSKKEGRWTARFILDI